MSQSPVKGLGLGAPASATCGYVSVVEKHWFCSAASAHEPLNTKSRGIHFVPRETTSEYGLGPLFFDRVSHGHGSR